MFVRTCDAGTLAGRFSIARTSNRYKEIKEVNVRAVGERVTCLNGFGSGPIKPPGHAGHKPVHAGQFRQNITQGRPFERPVAIRHRHDQFAVGREFLPQGTKKLNGFGHVFQNYPKR